MNKRNIFSLILLVCLAVSAIECRQQEQDEDIVDKVHTLAERVLLQPFVGDADSSQKRAEPEEPEDVLDVVRQEQDGRRLDDPSADNEEIAAALTEQDNATPNQTPDIDIFAQDTSAERPQSDESGEEVIVMQKKEQGDDEAQSPVKAQDEESLFQSLLPFLSDDLPEQAEQADQEKRSQMTDDNFMDAKRKLIAAYLKAHEDEESLLRQERPHTDYFHDDQTNPEEPVRSVIMLVKPPQVAEVSADETPIRFDSNMMSQSDLAAAITPEEQERVEQEADAFLETVLPFITIGSSMHDRVPQYHSQYQYEAEQAEQASEEEPDQQNRAQLILSYIKSQVDEHEEPHKKERHHNDYFHFDQTNEEPEDRLRQFENNMKKKQGAFIQDFKQQQEQQLKLQFTDDDDDNSEAARQYEEVDDSYIYIKLDHEISATQAQDLLSYISLSAAIPIESFQDITTGQNMVIFKYAPKTAEDANILVEKILSYRQEILTEKGFDIIACGLGRDRARIEVQKKPLISTRSKYFLLTTLIVCGAILCLLISLAAICVIRRRAYLRAKLVDDVGSKLGKKHFGDEESLVKDDDVKQASGFVAFFKSFGKKADMSPNQDYKELCRQRMQVKSNNPVTPMNTTVSQVNDSTMPGLNSPSICGTNINTTPVRTSSNESKSESNRSSNSS